MWEEPGKAREAVSSKQSEVSSQKSEKEQELDFLLPGKGEDSKPSHPLIEPRPRPKTTTGVTNKMKTSCGDLYVTVNEDENGRPFEVFCNMGKAGGCEGSQNEAIGRLISLAFRSGVSPQSVIRQLIGIRCNQPYGLGKNIIHSCSDAISKAVLEYMISKQGEVNKELSVEYDRRIGAACPDCGCEWNSQKVCEMSFLRAQQMLVKVDRATLQR